MFYLKVTNESDEGLMISVNFSIRGLEKIGMLKGMKKCLENILRNMKNIVIQPKGRDDFVGKIKKKMKPEPLH